ncbi:TonB-dependent receptor [Luteibacter anthropi]|uniref:TonB-dependent receptor n=1 Tax=Luteibacter anthropi TaxID=564369 RepID=A0A7X5ZJ32_9GAMM|nr:TonB-dependent receptor [Luteibacter anthropi]NII07356.1 TonB-dependent receptor [Luteibacter anthropi]URX62132.1 TonB-dependent receptor [Luteibacter anthropi]
MQLTKMAAALRGALVAMGVVWTMGYGAPGHAQAAAPASSGEATPSAGQEKTPASAQKKKDDAAATDDKKVTELGGIAVTGQLAALQRAQAIKQDAVNVVDSISAEETGKFPDANVADALQRVPGVSVNRSGGESSQIAVRGFGPDFVAVTVNGRKMATASGSRAFNFDVLPSEIISVAQVNKTSSADIPEVDIGGVVDIQTARPLDFNGYHGAWSAAGVNSNLTGDWKGKTTPKASGLFGWTNADHTFGWMASATYYKRKDTQLNTQANSWYANQDISKLSNLSNPNYTNVAVPETLASNVLDETRTRKGFSGAIDWKPIDRLTVQLDTLFSSYKVDSLEHEFGQYGNTADINSLTTDSNNTVLSYTRNGSGPNVMANDYVMSFIPSYEKSYQNGLNLGFDVDDSTKLSLDVSSSKAWNKQSPNGYFLVIGGKNFGTNPTWTNGGDNTPPSYSNILSSTDVNNLKAHCCNAGSGTNVTNKVNQYQIRLDKSFTDGVLSKLEFGGEYNDQSVKSVNWSTPNSLLCNAYCGYNITVPPDAVGAYIYNAPDKISGVSSPGLPSQWVQYDPRAYLAWLASPAAYNQLPADKKAALVAGLAANGGTLGAAPDPGSYNKVTEKEKSFFGKAVFEGTMWDKAWALDVGLRYVNVNSTSTAINRPPISLYIDPNDTSNGQVTFGGLTPQSANGGYHKWLPSLNFKWNLMDNLVYRFSASKSMTPPQLSNLYYNKGFGTRPNSLTISQGNPNLQPYTSRNFDMGLEWYIDDASYIALEGFYKKVSNFSTLVSTPVPFLTNQNTGQPFIWSLTQPINLNSSNIYGQELTINYQFTHVLPEPFDGLGVAFNYTHVSSSTTLSPGVIAASGKFAVPGIGNSANLSTYYEKGPVQVRLAYNWRGSYLESLSYGAGAQPATRTSYGQLDLSASYAFTPRLSLFVSGTNLTHEHLYDYSVYRNRFLYAEADGTVYTVGVRGSF